MSFGAAPIADTCNSVTLEGKGGAPADKDKTKPKPAGKRRAQKGGSATGLQTPPSSSKKKGRPRNNLIEETSKIEEKFKAADNTDVLWYGAEKKAWKRKFDRLSTDLENEMKQCDEFDMVAKLELASKTMSCIAQLWHAVSTHSETSAEFAKAFDSCKSFCSTHPVVELPAARWMWGGRHGYFGTMSQCDIV